MRTTSVLCYLPSPVIPLRSELSFKSYLCPKDLKSTHFSIGLYSVSYISIAFSIRIYCANFSRIFFLLHITTIMNHSIHIVDTEDLDDGQELATNRFSIFTQNLMLAEKVSKHQHLTPRTSRLRDDSSSYYSTEPRISGSTDGVRDPSMNARRPIKSTPANIGRPRTKGHPSEPSPPGVWTWRPAIPERISSMSTRRVKANDVRRPDLAAFHRRSCQLFASLDSTISASPTASAGSDTARSSTSTSPSLTSSISTQATSILDDQWFQTPTFPSFHIDINTDIAKEPDFRAFFQGINHSPRLGAPRSSSQLSPEVTTTEQIFWTSEVTREAEYAKIDAAHTGFKGFVKRILPKSWNWLHGKRRDFYAHPQAFTTPNRSSEDTDSVRRFRVSTSIDLDNLSTTQEVEPHVLPGIPGSPRIDLETGYVSSKHVKPRAGHKAFSRVRSHDALTKLFQKGVRTGKSAKRRST